MSNIIAAIVRGDFDGAVIRHLAIASLSDRRRSTSSAGGVLVECRAADDSGGHMTRPSQDSTTEPA